MNESTPTPIQLGFRFVKSIFKYTLSSFDWLLRFIQLYGDYVITLAAGGVGVTQLLYIPCFPTKNAGIISQKDHYKEHFCAKLCARKTRKQGKTGLQKKKKSAIPNAHA